MPGDANRIVSIGTGVVIVVRALLIGAGAVVVALFGLGAPAAGALTLDPPPVRLGPVTVDPQVSIDPKTGVAIDGNTQLPDGSSPSVSVAVGPDGAQVSLPGGVAVTVTPTTTASAPAASEPPAGAPVSPGRQPAPVGPVPAALATPTQSTRTAGADATLAPRAEAAAHASATSRSTTRATRPRTEARPVPTSGTAAVNGSIVEPHASQWSELAAAAPRVGLFLALLVLAFLLRVVVTAWTRDIRRRRALSAS